MIRQFLAIASIALATVASAQTAPTYQGQDGQTKEAIGTFPITGSDARPSGVASDQVQGSAANGTAPTGNPVLVAGSDGTNTRTVIVSPGGRIQADAQVGGTAANGVADNGNPIKVGGVASNGPPAPVTVGQRVNAWYTPWGAAMVAVGDPQNGNFAPLVAGSTDNKGDGVTGLAVDSNSRIYDGTRWVRQRDVASVTGTIGTGLAAAGLVSRAVTSKTAVIAGNYSGSLSDTFGNIFVRPTGSVTTAFNGISGSYVLTSGWDNPAYNGPLGTVQLLYNTGGQLDAASGDRNGAYVIGKGGSGIATGQVSVGTTATLIAASRIGRQKIGVTVTSAVQCAFGNAGVTLATGWPLAAVAYAADSWDTAAALYAVCASTATVGYREQF